MSAPDRSHLGINVYCWGGDAQRRLLVEQVAPLVRRLLDERTIERFWYTAFDARGPHLTLLSTAAERTLPALRERLRGEIARCLAAAPSDRTIDAAEIAERHRQCRGKVLCPADALPSVADNNSFVLFEHPADGYPFGFARGLERADELWRRVGEVVVWTLGLLGGRDAAPSAVRWTAAVDAAIERAGLAAEAYWRFHATTLVMPLAARLAADEAGVLASVPGVVGARNLESFDRLWSQVEDGGWSGPDVDALVALVSAAPDRDRWSLLREINHTTLGQLGLPVRLHLPLVFYAWQRNLSLTPAA